MTDHQWTELAAPYALGALDPEERARFEVLAQRGNGGFDALADALADNGDVVHEPVETGALADVRRIDAEAGDALLRTRIQLRIAQGRRQQVADGAQGRDLCRLQRSLGPRPHGTDRATGAHLLLEALEDQDEPRYHRCP